MSDLTPAQRIEAAIERLGRLRADAFPGPWEMLTSGVEGGDHWYVMAEDESILSISANDGTDEVYRRPTAGLICTLHATIDAQIGILSEALYQLTDGTNGTGMLGKEHNLIVRLADAIISGGTE
jgi:hypothetical protein